MAKAISKIPEVRFTGEATAVNLLEGHEEALSEALKLIDLLHDRGMLQLTAAVCEEGSGLLDILVRQMDQPGATGGLKNVMALVQGLGAMDSKGLSRLLHGVAEGTKLAAEGTRVEVNGIFDLMRVLSDPEVSAGLSWLFTLLKGMGQHVHAESHESGEVREGVTSFS